MVFSDLKAMDTKIVLSPGVSHFLAHDGSLLVKNRNKIYKVSAMSNLSELTRLLRMLEKPKKLKEVLTLLSGFKRDHVTGVLETMYKMKLISIEKWDSNKITDYFSSTKYLPWYGELRNDGGIGESKLVLIGDGLLASSLSTHLRNMKIKFDQVKYTQIITKSNRKLSVHDVQQEKTSLLNQSTTAFKSLINPFIETASLVIVADDYPNINLFELVNSLCFEKKKAWIRVSFDDDIGYLGPLVIPRRTSCFNCCELRLVTNSPEYEYELWNNKENISIKKPELPRIFVDVLSALCLKEIYRYLTDTNHIDTIDNLLIFDTQQVNLTKHHIISHPNCIFCNPPSKKARSPNPGSSRMGDLRRRDTNPPIEINKSDSLISKEELLNRLRKLIDKKTGIIQEYEKLYESHPLGIYFHHFSTATCSRPLRIGSNGRLTKTVRVEDNLISPSPSGSGLSATDAEIRTLMESVERYSNMVVDESQLIWSSYSKLKRNAVNPADLGLYSDEVYNRDGMECSRFTVNAEIPWVAGIDLYSRKTVMVPADFVFYPAIRERPLVFDTSNGASAHADSVRAILNGLYEVIERDSFLTMWLNKISMPILDANTLPFGFDESLKLINDYGMHVKLVDLTNDTSVPAIMAVCFNKEPDKAPALLVGAGAHIEPEKALEKALFEMEFMLTEMLEHPNKKRINRADQISTMYEHPLYYLNPNKRKFWEFMISGTKINSLQKFAKSSFNNNYCVLMHIVKHLHGMNHKVIAVDVTPRDISKMGVKTVKVFVTGFQPLYVGNNLRLNVDRLRTSGRRLGYNRDGANSGWEINSAPHPLP